MNFSRPDRMPGWGIPAILFAITAITLFAYGNTLKSEFVLFDDPAYVTENPYVRNGLTLEGTRWAFTTGHMGNWHPLTWLSLMLDVEIFGVRSDAMHSVSLLIHIINSLLLFALFYLMTGAAGKSALLASLFAVHPLHVESVAWVSERKDVLSHLFMLLAMAAYVMYTKRKSYLWYGASLLMSALGLMSKPMLVSLPICLLLLDFWPLGRIGIGQGRVRSAEAPARRIRGNPLWDKIPFAALVVPSMIVTWLTQGGAVTSFERIPAYLRLQNVLVSYVKYAAKAMWPVNLSFFYPFPEHLPWWSVMLSAAVLLVITAASLMLSRRAPCLIFGWLWYLVTLVPVIGIVQVGAQSMADRYTYIPLTGLMVLAVWGGSQAAAGMKATRWAAVLGTLAVIALTFSARAQVRVWQDSASLFRHGIAVDEKNWMAHGGYGNALYAEGKMEEAMRSYAESIRLNPNNYGAYDHMGMALLETGRTAEAVSYHRKALQLYPGAFQVRSHLGKALLRLGKVSEGREYIAGELEAHPFDVPSLELMALSFVKEGKTEEALKYYRRALSIDPLSPGLYSGMASALDRAGRREEAVKHLLKALELAPGEARLYYNLANVTAGAGRLREAEKHYREAIALDPRYWKAHSNLGALLVREGRHEEARQSFRKALQIHPDDSVARRYLSGPAGK